MPRTMVVMEMVSTTGAITTMGTRAAVDQLAMARRISTSSSTVATMATRKKNTGTPRSLLHANVLTTGKLSCSLNH